MSDNRGPRELAYDEHISPLMTQIIALCREHSIPMLASFELDYEEEHGGALHCTTFLVNDNDMRPSDDRLARARQCIQPPKPQWSAHIVHEDGRSECVAGSHMPDD